MPRIRFGTDGWRGLIAHDFTFDNVALCVQGVARYLLEEGMAARRLVIGYDTRFASQEFAGRVAEVLAGNGIASYLCTSAAPTPVVSYNILHRGAAGAAIITASHNRGPGTGSNTSLTTPGSATPEITARLEREIDAAEAAGVVSIPRPRRETKGTSWTSTHASIPGAGVPPGGLGRHLPGGPQDNIRRHVWGRRRVHGVLSRSLFTPRRRGRGLSRRWPHHNG